MQSRQSREQRIGAAVLDKTISPDARDWIIAALDPFHDFQRQLAGYPDSDSMHSTVACYNYELDVSKPAGAVGNWDAHVFSMPMLHNHMMHQVVSTNTDYAFACSGVGPPNQTLRNLGSLNVYTADAGQPLYQSTTDFNPSNFESRVIDAGPTAGSGMGRVIAWGFEVVNTTADMTKQGSLTAYRMPQSMSLDESCIFQGNSAIVYDKVLSQRLRSPPSTSSEAVLLGGTRQWAAADGAYVVVPQSTVANPIRPSTNMSVMTSCYCPLATGNHAMISTRASQGAIGTNNAPVTTPLLSEPQRVIPFNTVGLFLTGLSPSTTFRVKMKMYVEKAPTYADPSTSVLATPSAAYNARVLELYSACLSQLPIAVPVGMNGFGDWFRTVLDIIGKVALPLGAAFGPQGALIGGGVATIADTIRTVAYKDETKQAVKKMRNDLATSNAPTAPKPLYRVRVNGVQRRIKGKV